MYAVTYPVSYTHLTQKVYAIFGKLYQQQGGEQGANPEQPQAGTQNADGTYEAVSYTHLQCGQRVQLYRAIASQ